MSADREAQDQPRRDKSKPAGPASEHGSAEAGAESYGGDVDSGPSVTEEEVEAGLERDQAEG